MGIVYTTIRVRNALKGGEALDLEAEIDTGATLLVLPGQVARDLELPVIRQQTVKYANEDMAERDVVWGVEVEVIGRKGIFEAVVDPMKKYALIGAVLMESLDLIVEPRSLGLYPNPRSRLPMAEIE